MDGENMLQNALNSIDDGVVVFDGDGKIVFANKIGEELKSINLDEIDEEEPVEHNGEYFLPVKKKIPSGSVVIWRNVSAEEELKKLMVIDPELGIYNSKFMKDMLEREMDRVNSEGSQMALALIDVDPGENGPSLSEIAQTLRKTVRNFDHVCRGDRSDFALLLFVVDPDKIDAVGHRLFNVLKKLGVDKVSIGLTLSGRSPSSEAMMKQAQRALYVVNARGGNDISIY
ncbi:diguanylate cyclase [bacterium]|nr:diguanylate cyclase [bacterium]